MHVRKSAILLALVCMGNCALLQLQYIDGRWHPQSRDGLSSDEGSQRLKGPVLTC